MEHLVRGALLTSGGLVLRDQDARELPVLCIDADGGREHAGLLRGLAVARDLFGKGGCQVGIEGNVLLLLIEKARFPTLALQRVQHEPRLDLRAAKTVGD